MRASLRFRVLVEELVAEFVADWKKLYEWMDDLPMDYDPDDPYYHSYTVRRPEVPVAADYAERILRLVEEECGR